MKEIYVDGSGKGGIGIVVVEDGEVKSLMSKKLYVAKHANIGTLMEFYAVLEGLRLAEEGDYVITDQTNIIKSLLSHGKLVIRHNAKNKGKVLYNKLRVGINNELKNKVGVTLYDVKGHNGDKFHDTADRLARANNHIIKDVSKTMGVGVKEVKVSLNNEVKGIRL